MPRTAPRRSRAFLLGLNLRHAYPLIWLPLKEASFAPCPRLRWLPLGRTAPGLPQRCSMTEEVWDAQQVSNPHQVENPHRAGLSACDGSLGVEVATQFRQSSAS